MNVPVTNRLKDEGLTRQKAESVVENLIKKANTSGYDILPRHVNRAKVFDRNDGSFGVFLFFEQNALIDLPVYKMDGVIMNSMGQCYRKKLNGEERTHFITAWLVVEKEVVE